jgi:hypothetical protein
MEEGRREAGLETGGTMAKRSRHGFVKFQKELKRKKKAKEKMARRQGKKEESDNPDHEEKPDTDS